MRKSTELDAEIALPERINWFPGHMAKALREVKERIKQVDLIIEVRDARIPMTSANSSLLGIIGNKNWMVVMNKSNLAESNVSNAWQTWFQEKGIKALFVNALDQPAVKHLERASKETMKKKWETFRKKGIQPPPLRLMIVGIPNTGKSTLINRLTKRKAAKTGERPGVTRHQEWIVLGKDIELLDTPGIMPPRIEREEQGLWLCAVHAIRDEIISRERLARFIIETSKEKNPIELKKRYKLEYLDQDVDELILLIGKHLNYIKHKGDIDSSKTCNQILKDFRNGSLGQCSFESPPD